MKPREQIKKAHEDAVIGSFLTWFNSKYGTNFEIIDKPVAPDAIAQDGDKYVWIEHADIYRSAEEAREERSAVTPGEKAYKRQERSILSPDERTAIAFVSTLNKKLSKESYEKWHNKYGQGILILTERDPLFDQSTWECINEHLNSCNFEDDKGFFKKVFFGYHCMNGLDFVEVDLKNSKQWTSANSS